MKCVYIIKYSDCPDDIIVFSSRKRAITLLIDQYQTGNDYGNVAIADYQTSFVVNNEDGILAVLTTHRLS